MGSVVEIFDRAFQHILELEGGYVNDPDDPGGETKYGISKRSYPALDIANLTQEDAKRIYYDDYFVANHYDLLKDVPEISVKLFTMAVHFGGKRASEMLQKAMNMLFDANLHMDGQVGQITANVVNGTVRPGSDEHEALYRLLCHYQANYYESLGPGMSKYLRGWLRRAVR